MQIADFAEAHARLSQFYEVAASPGGYTLERIRKLAAYLGNPQQTFRIIHVAGTSGKTSTAYFVAALLKAGGAKVGLTVSPHVDEVNERVQIGMTPLPERQFCDELGVYLDLVEASGVKPSYFEALTAFAFWEFARQQVDYAVVEVGLGGLLDATNIITREDKVCVITDIGLDHTEILGDTLGAIASQKAGIIQQGNHVFMLKQPAEVLHVIERQCEKQHAPLEILNSTKPDAPWYGTLPLFQQRNFTLARRAVRYVLARDARPALTSTQLRQAAAQIIPARMEQFSLANKTVILDGAHNAQKIGALRTSIRQRFPDQRVAVLAAFVSGKDEQRWQQALSELLRLSRNLIITSFASAQDFPKTSVNPHRIATFCHQQGVTPAVIEDPAQAFRRLLSQPEPVLLATGSFYLLNHIRPLMQKEVKA